MKILSLSGSKYFMVITNDHNDFYMGVFFKSKGEALKKFQIFKTMIENVIDH
jgi:hypothetical protein